MLAECGWSVGNFPNTGGDVDVVQQDGSLLRAEQVTYLVGLERITARPAANQQVFSRLRLTPTPKPGTPAVAP